MSVRAVWAVVVMAIIATGAWLAVRQWSAADIPAPPALPASLERAEPDVAELIRRVHEEVTRTPTHAEGWDVLGRTFEVSLMCDQALDCYRQAASLEPDDPRYHYRLGALAADTGDLITAESELRTVISIRETYAPAHWRIGQLLLDAYRLDEAEAAFRRAIELDDRDPAGWTGLARVQLQRGDAQEAVDLLESLLTWVPVNQHYVSQLLGTAYRQAGRHADADAMLTRGRGVTMQWPDPWRDEMNQLRRDVQWQHQYAVSLISAGRPDQAAGILVRLIEQRPGDASLRSNLAVALRMMGRLDESIDVLQRTVAQHPGAHEAQFNLALAYRMKSVERSGPERQRLLDLAVRHDEAALQANPSYAPALGLRGELLAEAGEVSAAVGAYREATRADPATPIWLLREAEVLADAGRIDDAANALADALRRAPAYLPALYRLVELRLDQGDLEAAGRLADRIERLQPRDPRAAALLERVRRTGPAPRESVPGGER